MKFKMSGRVKRIFIACITLLLLLGSALVPLFSIMISTTDTKHKSLEVILQDDESKGNAIGDPIGDPAVENLNTSEVFTTIQDAINDSNTVAGNILEVNSSTYAENVIVNKSVIIRGNGTDENQPLLIGGNEIGFIIQVDNVTIENMNISDSSVGIFCNHSGLQALNNTFWFDNHSIDFNYTSNFASNTNYHIYENTIENNVFFINTTNDYDGAILVNLALNYQNHSGTATIEDFTISDNRFFLNNSHAYAVYYNENSIKWLTDGSISIGMFNFSHNIIYKNNSGNNGVYFTGSLSHLTNDTVIVDDIIVSHNLVINQTNAALCLYQYMTEDWSGTTTGVFGDILVMNNDIDSFVSSDGIQISQTDVWDFQDEASLSIGECHIDSNDIVVSEGYAIVLYMNNVGYQLQNFSAVHISQVSISSNVITAGNGFLIDYYQCGNILSEEANCTLHELQVLNNTVSSMENGIHIQQFSYLGSELNDNATFMMSDIHLDDNEIESGLHGIYFSGLLLGENLSDSSTCSINNLTVNDNVISSGGDGILFTDNVSSFRLGNSMTENSLVTFQDIEMSGNTLDDSETGIFIGPCHFGGENDRLALNSFTISNNSISLCSNGLKLQDFSISDWCQPVIRNNFVDNCSIGIWLNSSYNNLIYNNYFDNNQNAKDDTENNWNIAKTAGANILGGSYRGGNYWSDYTGLDGDDDTLGDTLLPYTSGGNISTGGDYRPLTLATGDLTLTPPMDFTTTVVGTTQINLSWDKGIHAVYTRVMQKIGGYPVSISDGSLVYNGTGVSCSNVSLSAGVTYYFRAWSWNDTTMLWSTENASSSSTTWMVPLVPSGFYATTVQIGRINLSWTKGGYATHTRIQRNVGTYPENVNDGTNVYNGTMTSVSDPGLSEGTTYYYRAWSWNSTSRLWSSTNVSARNTTWYTPLAPTSVQASTVGIDRIDLTWSKGYYAMYTRVMQKTGGYPVSISDGSLVYNGTGVSCLNTSLSAGVHYYFRIWSWNSTSGLWSTTNASTENTTWNTPLAPTGFSAITVAIDHINISWILGVRAVYTRVMQKTDGYPVNISDGVLVYNGTGVSCSCPNLTIGTRYYFRAWSWNDTSQAWSFTNSSTTNFTGPFAPRSLTATSMSPSQINLAWEKGEYASYTHIQRKTGSYPTNISDGTTVYNGTGSSFENTGLTASTKYYYRAWSRNSSRGIWSVNYADAQATTQGGGNPAPPPSSDNEAPTAHAGGPYLGSVNQTITFNGAGSSDDVGVVGYRWDWTNDGTWDTEWLSSSTMTYRYTTEGKFILNLQVQDVEGLRDNDTTTVTITKAGTFHQAPVADAGGPYQGLTYQNIRFNGSKSYAINSSIVNYTWVFGDGFYGYDISPVHSYSSAGTFTIILTIKDTNNLQSIDTTMITIELDANRNNISDIIDQVIGIDITQADLHLFSINGVGCYLVDTNHDGIFDVFYNPSTNQKTSLGVHEKSVLIDIDGDGYYDYIYDPTLGLLIPYEEVTSFLDSPWFSVALSILIVIVILLVVWLYKTGRI